MAGDDKQAQMGIFERLLSGKVTLWKAFLLGMFLCGPVALLLLAAVFVLLQEVAPQIDDLTARLIILIPQLAVGAGVFIVWQCAFNQPFRWLGYAIRVFAAMLFLVLLLLVLIMALFIPELRTLYETIAAAL
ncbi:MAG TPA: hypothetical protein VM532_04175 [Burkholderiales bacterium]|nr:hypothetical protein [Burkholderiales bacterium]